MKLKFRYVPVIVEECKRHLDEKTITSLKYETDMRAVLRQSKRAQDAIAWILYYGKKVGIVISIRDIENYKDWADLVA